MKHGWMVFRCSLVNLNKNNVALETLLLTSNFPIEGVLVARNQKLILAKVLVFTHRIRFGGQKMQIWTLRINTPPTLGAFSPYNDKGGDGLKYGSILT